MRTKHPELDDIGSIGDGSSFSEEESKLVSAHIQAYKAKHPAPKRKTIKRGATEKLMRDAVKARPKKAKGADAKLRTLDDIDFIGGGRPYTDADARAVSAFIQAQKAKRTAAKPAVRRAPAKRKAKAQ
jgi:triosephosphate isomerase